MNNKSKVSVAFLYVSLLAFILYTIYVLYLNQEVLYTAQDRSEFLYGASFFHTIISKPFGLLQYVGAWLTQFFYEPALGSGMLVAIWALTFLVGMKAFRLQGGAAALMLLPVACLLTSVVDLGYWVYISTIRGYWFSQSVGYLMMVLLLWAARCTPRKWHPIWYLVGFCIYPVLGWFALLFIICLMLTEKPSWWELLGFVLLISAAIIWHALLYSHLMLDDVVMAGLPYFDTAIDSSPHLSIPFWVLGIVSILIPLCGRYLAKAFVPVLCAVAGILFTTSLRYSNHNYIEEMRMVRYAFDDNWQKVIKLAEKNNQPTRTMVFLKNIALMNEGELLDRSFKLHNNVVNINNPDSLHVSLLNIAAPLVYYNYGMMNEAIRLDYEVSIQTGFSPFHLKMLSRCSMAQGDNQLVERYTTILHHHPFYRNWQPAPVSKKVNELQHAYPDELAGIENSESYLVSSMSLWYETDSKLAIEQSLLYAMIRCDARRFWPSLRKYVMTHQNEAFPLHAQEAYILFMDRAPEEKRMMLPVEQAVYDRYKLFWEAMKDKVKPGKTLRDVGEEVREEWGGTYWWYFLFGR